jgi:type IX secretion system substrate protein
MKLKIIIFLSIFLFTKYTYTQNRWTNEYLSGQNPFAIDIARSYDKGYLLYGKYEPNYSSFNWLIKTDINGEILWNKTFGDENSVISFGEIETSNDGTCFLVGSTYYYGEDNPDPLIMKINACGEKEWCRVFFEDGNNYANVVEITSEEDVVVVLKYMNPDISKDRICLAKLSGDGEFIWKRCYNSNDTSIYNGEARDLTICPDGGFLITGSCYYEDPNPPNYLWKKPYFIKTDSDGFFEWETVIQPDADDPGGDAWSTVINSDSNYFYSSISHYYYNPTEDAPAIVKLDMLGNLVDIFDIAPPDEKGKLVNAKFVNDSILVASASWGHEPTSSPKAVLIDTLGNMINSAFLLNNTWMAETEITYDGKLFFLTNDHDNNDNFSTYLFKLNQQLESDTIYTAQFTYDSLCPYQIVNDTIVQDNCGLIVGDKEIVTEENTNNIKLIIYPNPATNKFIIKTSNLDFQGSTIEIFDLYGKKIETIIVSDNESEIEVVTKNWNKGLYLIRVYGEHASNGNGKVMIR